MESISISGLAYLMAKTCKDPVSTSKSNRWPVYGLCLAEISHESRCMSCQMSYHLWCHRSSHYLTQSPAARQPNTPKRHGFATPGGRKQSLDNVQSPLSSLWAPRYCLVRSRHCKDWTTGQPFRGSRGMTQCLLVATPCIPLSLHSYTPKIQTANRISRVCGDPSSRLLILLVPHGKSSACLFLCQIDITVTDPFQSRRKNTH